jgi:hypothetical protein
MMPAVRELTRDAASRLWRRVGVRRLAFSVGLVLQLGLVGFALGWVLTTGNPRTAPRHVTIPVLAHTGGTDVGDPD